MIHFHTVCKEVNDIVGLGVFATSDIPKGTIVNFESDWDIAIPQIQYETFSLEQKTYVDRYSYEDEQGNYRISWDHGRYINHCCFSNTLSTSFGFEIAVRNIKKGEQITCDYRIFCKYGNETTLYCEQNNCCKKLNYQESHLFIEIWNKKITSALKEINKVAQPLLSSMDSKLIIELQKHIG